MTHSTAQYLSVGASMAGESGRSLTGLARAIEPGLIGLIRSKPRLLRRAFDMHLRALAGTGRTDTEWLLVFLAKN